MENAIKISESQLKRMIQKEVERQMNDYIAGERLKSCFRDGKMVTEERKYFVFKDIIDMVDHPRGGGIESMALNGPFNINEGLIRSYPDDFVVRMMGRLFHLKSGNRIDAFSCSEYIGYIQLKQSPGNSKENDIYVECTANQELIEKMKNVFKTYGWFMASDYFSTPKKGNYVLRFEKKFPLFATTSYFLRNGAQYLYHISNTALKEKILKNGLVPHKNTIGDNQNPSRLYFYGTEPYENSVDAWGTRGNKNLKGVLFQIDLNKLNPNQKFYLDPRSEDALYTEEPIPYNAIKEIKPKEFDPYEKFY